MSYYKPTNLLQKIFKLIQLFWYFLRLKALSNPKPRAAKHTGVLMVVSKLDRIGGVELQALELSTEMVRQGCLITVLTDRIDDSPEIEFRSGFLIRRLTRSTNPVRLCISLVSFFIRHNRSFEVVHAHGVTGFTVLALRLAKLFGRPAILKGATQHDFANIFQRNNFKHRLYRRWILNTQAFIAISNEMKKEMISCGIPEDRIKRFANVVNSNKFFPVSNDRKLALRSRFSVPADQTLFLFLGRLEGRKAVDVLLNAWQKSSPGILWIVGSGVEEEKLKKISGDLNLKNVVFHGESRNPPDHYNAADVFVFPSRKEGSPGVVLEAMSCGLPCIATRIGGIVDMMEDREQGLIVAPDNPDELANAIAYAGSNLEERKKWGDEARETVLRLHDISRIAAEYKTLYVALCSEIPSR